MLLQRQSPTLRPLTTAHLAQTMTLLELTSDELRQKIEASLASNPALELLDTPRCPQCHRILHSAEPCPVCTKPQDPFSDEPIIFVSPQWDFISRENSYSEEGPLSEEWSSLPEDLATFVLRQIAPELTEPERPLAAHILTSLDEDGLLRIPLLEIARYHHVTLESIQEVQRLIQRAEPWGVGSSSPQQALLAQLEILSEMRPVPELAARAINEGLGLLSRHTYHELGRLQQE